MILPETVARKQEPAYLLNEQAFLQIGQHFLELAQRFLYSETRPVYQPMPASVITMVRDAPLVDQGISSTELFAEMATLQDYASFGGNHRAWYGGVGGGINEWAIPAAIFATMINPNCLGGDQSATYAELAVIRWLAELVGFPGVEPAGGLLMSGASQATLTALAAARQRAARRKGIDIREQGLASLRLTTYASDQTHASVAQQINILGIEPLRLIPSDPMTLQIDVAALQRAITRDREQGFLPIAVIGNAGTTNTGTIDSLSALADLCAMEDLWFHVDGAYGAFGFLDERIRPLYAGMERADSLALDPHKWLAAPYENGALLVRDRKALLDTFGRPTPAYLQQMEEQHPHFGEWGLQLSRGPHSLVLWIILRTLGSSGARDIVMRTRDLAALLNQKIREIPHMRLMSSTTLTAVCFRYEPPGMDERGICTLNQRILQYIQKSQEAYPTATTFEGNYALRACILHPRSDENDIYRFLTVLQVAIRRKE